MSGGAVAPPSGRKFERDLGRFGSGRPGPAVLVTGGLHGNEPAGVLAAERVLARLAAAELPLRGTLTAVAGNLRALALGRRYVDRDLNRAWMADHIASVAAGGGGGCAEDDELRALLAIIDEAAATATGPLVALDLHTTSGRSPPFSLMADTLRNRRISFALPMPVILGLEEAVDGTLLEYLTERGHVAVVAEAGQHDDPGSIDRHESVIWLGLVAAGSLRAAEVPDYAVHRERLAEACRGLPRVVEVRGRHAIAEGDAFRMRPGYVGFQPVRRDEVLGEDRHGDVRATEDGRLLMPLYQEQGNDGFFVVRKVRRLWMAVSALCRRLHLQVVLPALPGVRRHPDLPRTLRVDPKVARWFVVEIFHLFGYRRRRREGAHLVFSRRR